VEEEIARGVPPTPDNEEDLASFKL
jgi:hypothetical protein